MVDVQCFVGIDVAKAQLAIALRPTGERWAVPNDPHGCVTLVNAREKRCQEPFLHGTAQLPITPPTPGGALKAHAFIGTAEVNASTAKMRLVQIAKEIISILAGDSHATVKVSVEITADFPEGVSDYIKRAISENATSLGFKNKTWE